MDTDVAASEVADVVVDSVDAVEDMLTVLVAVEVLALHPEVVVAVVVLVRQPRRRLRLQVRHLCTFVRFTRGLMAVYHWVHEGWHAGYFTDGVGSCMILTMTDLARYGHEFQHEHERLKRLFDIFKLRISLRNYQGLIEDGQMLAPFSITFRLFSWQAGSQANSGFGEF